MPRRRATDSITKFERPWKLVGTIIATLVGLATAIVLTVGAIVSSKLADLDRDRLSKLAEKQMVQQQLNAVYPRLNAIDKEQAETDAEILAAKQRLDDFMRRVEK